MADAVPPVPAIGLPLTPTGGQAAAHAPVQVLVLPVSRWNRYTVRPFESARSFPSPLFSAATVALLPSAAFAGVPSARPPLPPPPPPHPAIARTAGSTAAVAKMVV